MMPGFDNALDAAKRLAAKEASTLRLSEPISVSGYNPLTGHEAKYWAQVSFDTDYGYMVWLRVTDDAGTVNMILPDRVAREVAYQMREARQSLLKKPK